MKRLNVMTVALVAALVLMVGLLVGCSTTGGSQSTGGTTQLTPAQVVQIACPPLESSLTTFQEVFASNPTDPNSVKVAADLAKAAPVVAQVCSIGATLDTSSVASLANTALPALSELAGYLNLPAAQLQQVRTGLLAAQVVLSVANVVEQNIQAAQAAKSASAPAAASSTGH